MIAYCGHFCIIAHEFAAENVASQRKFGAGNALNSVSLDFKIRKKEAQPWTQTVVAVRQKFLYADPT
jgi:hypothetical protein